MMDHIRYAHRTKTIVCELCGKKFLTTSFLKCHQRKHSGERPFLCNGCPRTFITLAQLKRHHFQHHQYKPHHCDVCEKRFCTPKELKEHRSVLLIFEATVSQNSSFIFHSLGDLELAIIIISLLMSPLLERLGHDPPHGPSADWRLLTTANVAGTNGLTCLPKHGGTRDSQSSNDRPLRKLLNFNDRSRTR
ncbi:hypothetical protein evm_015033 [Chilo suppressalis]|nr:hypothetical protein evm_015033 [Chilo suppressalis]